MSSESKIKVLFVLPGLEAGGAERVLITLMNSLPAAGYEKVMVAVNGKGPLASLIGPDVRFYDLGGKHMLLSLPALHNVWRSERPDIVISTMAHMNFGVLLLSGLFPKTKILVREAIVPSYFFDKYRRFAFALKCAYRFLYKRADLIIAPSKIVLNELQQLKGMGGFPFKLLYNPVSTSEQNYPYESSGKIQFVSVGRLDPQKGFDELIAVLQTTRFDFEWEWRIVGEGPQRLDLENFIRQTGLQDYIFLEGFRRDPQRYYQNADVLLLPSRWEGMPNVALESLASGTPVIALKSAGGIGEIAELCDARDVTVASTMKDFAVAMQGVVKKRERNSLLPKEFFAENVFAEFERVLKTL